VRIIMIYLNYQRRIGEVWAQSWSYQTRTNNQPAGNWWQ